MLRRSGFGGSTATAKKLVIDASILVKWYVNEADSDKALVLRDKHVNGELDLAAPFLIIYETLNTLKYADLFSGRELKDIAVSIQNYDILMYSLEGKTADLTLEVAEKNNITIYDSSYVGLAMNLGTEFITADQKLIDKLTGDYAKLAKHLRAF